MILLSPQKLSTDGIVLASFQIVKSAKSIDYKAAEFNSMELQRRFQSQPKPIKDVLQVFTQTGIAALKSRLSAAHSAKQSGKSFEQYFQPAFLREIHGCISLLMPLLEKTKCYHKINSTSGGVRTSPCTFQNIRPVIQFELKRKAGCLSISTTVRLGNSFLPLEELTRSHFLLEKDNVYHLLGYKDYQVLEWLNSKQVADAGRDETVFRKTVLAKLEETYKVNRNNLLGGNRISSSPESQVMVNELNDTFLMLTPQWLYEGFLIEGNFKENTEILKNGEAYSIMRDGKAEDELRHLLTNLHPAFEKQPNGYFFLSFEDARKKNWFLKTYHHLLDMGIRITGMDLLRHFRFSEHKAAVEMEISNGKNEHELCLLMRVTFGEEVISLLIIQQVLLSGQHTLLLSDDSLGVLDEAWQHKYGDIFRHGRIKDDEIYVDRWMAITEQNEPEGSQLLKPVLADDWWGLWDRWQTGEATIFKLPHVIEAEQLRPYQQRGFEWLVLLARIGAGACLADDMGLGKTLQTICFLAYQRGQFPGMKHLVACPASLVYNWQQEFKKFAPALRLIVFYGNGRNAGDLQKDDYDIVITSLGTLRSDIEFIESIPFCVAVVDESHHIKNPNALITRAVNRIDAATKVALSGTPVMNNTFDLYSQLNFVVPGMFGSREFFKRMYADPIDKDHDPAKIKLLQKLTAPFILRRTKEQVATDLPDKTELVLWCDMGMQQRDFYDDVRSQIKSSIFLEIERGGFERSKLSIIQGIIKLRQACNSPLLLPNDGFACEDSIKTELLVDELLNNLKGHKVLVFSQFSKMLVLLAKQLHEQQIDFFHFDGQTPPKQRMEMVNSFQQQGNTTNVFLISLMAGNMGLNLTAADYVFLFDPWWNTAVQQQAIDRTHRIGQTKKVFAYKMICRDTIEEKILHLQERKKHLSDSLIGGEDGFVKNLTLQDLEYLLK
jgi:superfamily II DNA or RNA helicase